jgi:carbamate kinase
MSHSPQTIVVALGGNALVAAGETPTIASQAHHADEAMRAVVPLIERGNRVVLTHGNGLQVGNILIRVERALGSSYSLPLDVCVAESQGELGYLLELALHNALADRGTRRPVVGVLTQVVVAADDPAFEHPTKPVGPWFDLARARALEHAGFRVVEELGRGWRKVVASPRPLEIVDVDVIRWLLDRGAVVVAAGGGGIPVARDADDRLRGVPAVIDKDFASALLARAIDARSLLILTGEPAVYASYRLADQRALRTLTPVQARRLAAEGHFAPGSMGPKVAAALEFVEAGGERAIITSAARLREAMLGTDGTTISRTDA